MQALQLDRPGALSLRPVARPEPGPGEVLLRVLAAGICGTDRHLYHGTFPSKPPLTLGHEFCGRVEAVGPGVSRIKPGDLVTGDPNIACGTCPACRGGRVNLCPGNVAIGVHRDGAMADYVLMPESQAHPLPAGLDPLLGALCEPLACTLHGLDLAAIRPGEDVTVLGGGVIGQLAVQLARMAGAGEVTLVTRNAAKRALGEKLGASRSATELTGQAEADVVLECAGVAETVEAAPRLTRPGGRVVILGVLAKGQKTAIEPFDLLFREITLIHSFINPFTQARAADLIATGTIRGEELISRVIPLSASAAAIAEPPGPQDVKVMIRP